jgi:hypothetical protein
VGSQVANVAVMNVGCVLLGSLLVFGEIPEYGGFVPADEVVDNVLGVISFCSQDRSTIPYMGCEKMHCLGSTYQRNSADRAHKKSHGGHVLHCWCHSVYD